jgi:hypothetical protein
MLGRISTIIEIIVNCIVCEREIGILASSLAMGLGWIVKIIITERDIAFKLYLSNRLINACAMK